MGVNNITNTYANMQKSRKAKIEHPFLNLVIFYLAAIFEMKQKYEEAGEKPKSGVVENLLSEINMLTERLKQLESTEGYDDRVLPPGIGELFASRLAKQCGILAPEIRLSESQPSNTLYYWKRAPGGFVGSKILPHSLPIYYLKSKDKTLPPELAGLEKLEGAWAFKSFGMKPPPIRLEAEIRNRLNKSCPLSREYYNDFSEQDENALAIIQAAKWDAIEKMKIHAFRAFLYCTYCHSSNVLIDTQTRLWSIDHANIMMSRDAADIERLAFFVNHSDTLKRVCQQISIITERDIERALQGIDKRFWKSGGVFDNPIDAAHHFSVRLTAWQKCFGTAGFDGQVNPSQLTKYNTKNR